MRPTVGTRLRLFLRATLRLIRQRRSQIFRVVTQTVQARGKAMHDRHQVFDHLAFGRQLLVIEHQEVAAVSRTRAREPRIPKRVSRSLCAITSVVTSRRSTESITSQNFLRSKFKPPPTSSIHSTSVSPRAAQNVSSTRF